MPSIHPLLSPSPPAPNPSQHQGLFQWVNSLHELAKVLEFQLQHQCFQWTPVSQFFAWVGQSTGVSASASVLPMNTQDWSPLGWTGWISLQSKGLSSLFQHHSSKASVLQCSAFFTVQLSHPYMTTGKTIALTRQTFVGKVMSLLLHMLSRLVITFLPRSKHRLISWLQSPSAVILEPEKIKSNNVSSVSPSMSHQVSYLYTNKIYISKFL